MIEIYNTNYKALGELIELFVSKFYEKVDKISYFEMGDEILWGKHFVKYYKKNIQQF